MTRAPFVRTYRLVGAALIFSAAVYTWVVKWNEATFSPANFFSYFTNLSNLFAASVFLAGALGVAGATLPRFEMVRGAATLYMVVTGVVYNVALSGYDSLAEVTPAYTNLIMHQLMPIVVLADWLFEPPRARLGFRRALGPWLAFPVVYLAYTMIRGPIVDWYPYPFLDPTRDGGYLRVAASVAVIASGFVLLTWGLTGAAGIFRSLRDRSDAATRLATGATH